MAEGEDVNEGHAAAKAVCPYFQRVIHDGRAILCADDVMNERRQQAGSAASPFRFLKLAFHNSRDRVSWSEDYCETYCYHACPIYQAMRSIAEVEVG